MNTETTSRERQNKLAILKILSDINLSRRLSDIEESIYREYFYDLYPNHTLCYVFNDLQIPPKEVLS